MLWKEGEHGEYSASNFSTHFSCDLCQRLHEREYCLDGRGTAWRSHYFICNNSQAQDAVLKAYLCMNPHSYPNVRHRTIADVSGLLDTSYKGRFCGQYLWMKK